MTPGLLMPAFAGVTIVVSAVTIAIVWRLLRADHGAIVWHDVAAELRHAARHLRRWQAKALIGAVLLAGGIVGSWQVADRAQQPQRPTWSVAEATQTGSAVRFERSGGNRWKIAVPLLLVPTALVGGLVAAAKFGLVQ